MKCCVMNTKSKNIDSTPKPNLVIEPNIEVQSLKL